MTCFSKQSTISWTFPGVRKKHDQRENIIFSYKFLFYLQSTNLLYFSSLLVTVAKNRIH